MEEDDSGNEVTGVVKKQKRGERGKGKVVDLTNLIVEGKRRDQGKIQTVSHDKSKEKKSKPKQKQGSIYRPKIYLISESYSTMTYKKLPKAGQVLSFFIECLVKANPTKAQCLSNKTLAVKETCDQIKQI